MTVDEVVSKEIEGFAKPNGLAWCDGISWIPKTQLNDADRDAAYEKVFAALLENGRKFGCKDPIVHHNGNGHYVVCERNPKDKNDQR